MAIERNLMVITPVKDSIETTKATIASVRQSHAGYPYLVYNDFSTEDTEKELENLKAKFEFELINLSDLTTTPSPNYDIILRDAQKRALASRSDLVIIESDVVIKKDTLERLSKFANAEKGIGLAGAITVDEKGDINFPYLKFRNEKDDVIYTNRSLSFCCTLLTHDFLKAFPFEALNHSKDWYDTTISHKAIELGFRNAVLSNTEVLHKPHSSRPWKQLKYRNPIKYYFNKWITNRDKI